uniref:thyroid adenoma-associated protein homolog n=1 Tax=Ictidomys tridecemlineatus TaxID=43179 RepID=UPI001A9D307A|nr:thyroid adenoma-associated protein homolog [Ictidomys tridecemlineatus]
MSVDTFPLFRTPEGLCQTKLDYRLWAGSELGNLFILTEQLMRCPNVSLQKLPEQWLWNVLEEIKSSDPSSKLCATRHSAGIPFYIQALLAS